MKKTFEVRCDAGPPSLPITSGTKVNIRFPQHSLLRAEPDATLTAAAAKLIKAPWPAEAIALASIPGSSSTPHHVAEVGPYDVAGAYLAGGSSGFGEYGNCDPRRRCVGCADGCGDELRFIRHTADRKKTLLLVVAGGSSSLPEWLRVAIVEPGRAWSGTSYIPAIYHGSNRLILASEAGGPSFGVGPSKLAALGPHVSPPWRIAAFDCALQIFKSAACAQIMPGGQMLQQQAPSLSIEL